MSRNVISTIGFGSFVCAAAYVFVMLGGDGRPRGGDIAAGMISTAQNLATSMTALLSGASAAPCRHAARHMSPIANVPRRTLIDDRFRVYLEQENRAAV
jgi:hypothetical protein